MPHAVAVAVSGGRDSTALLHATAHAAAVLGIEVHALHVHHGLVADADHWLHHLQAQCRRWARAGLPLTFHARRLSESPAPGDSIEAWARRQRYRSLAEMARDAGCDLVLLAHHRRDQAETLLLQALRGGGPAGLAAMPRSALRDGITWARPWLAWPREAIEAYVQRHRLSYVDDDSNADPRFARNRLRSQVWPALARAFADAEPQLHAAALRAAEAAAALDELARGDQAACCDGDALLVPRWQALSGPRRTLLLRHWLQGAPESLVQRLAAELPTATVAQWPAPGGELRLYDGALRRHRDAPPIPAASLSIDLSRPGRHDVPAWGGCFIVEVVAHGGLGPSRLRQARLRGREGGEDFQAAPAATPRSLKKQFQSRRMPAWQRGGPLVFDGGTLLFVPGLGIDARCVAAPGGRQLSLRWEPLAAG